LTPLRLKVAISIAAECAGRPGVQDWRAQQDSNLQHPA
jgi:hypothetical protein